MQLFYAAWGGMVMSAPYMQFYVADYLGDTRHLTTEQHGAYLLLLMTMWRSEGFLPNDDKKLARIAGCTPSRWGKIKGDVMEYFQIEGEFITNKRLMLEFKKAKEKSIKRAEAGIQGVKAKSLKNNNSPQANAEPLLKHLSEPESEPEKKVKKRPSYPDDFLSVWKAFPHYDGRSAQNKSYDQWRLLPDDERSSLPEAIAKLVSSTKPDDVKFIPAMERWLRDGKHRHFLNDKQPEEQITDERWLWRISKGKENGWRAEWGDPPDSANTNCPPHLRKEWKQSISD